MPSRSSSLSGMAPLTRAAATVSGSAPCMSRSRATETVRAKAASRPAAWHAPRASCSARSGASASAAPKVSASPLSSCARSAPDCSVITEWWPRAQPRFYPRPAAAPPDALAPAIGARAPNWVARGHSPVALAPARSGRILDGTRIASTMRKTPTHAAHPLLQRDGRRGRLGATALRAVRRLAARDPGRADRAEPARGGPAVPPRRHHLRRLRRGLRHRAPHPVRHRPARDPRRALGAASPRGCGSA